MAERINETLEDKKKKSGSAKLLEVLIPLLAGGASAYSQRLARGVNAGANIWGGIREQKRADARVSLEEEDRTRRRRRDERLGDLLSERDPEPVITPGMKPYEVEAVRLKSRIDKLSRRRDVLGADDPENAMAVDDEIEKARARLDEINSGQAAKDYELGTRTKEVQLKSLEALADQRSEPKRMSVGPGSTVFEIPEDGSQAHPLFTAPDRDRAEERALKAEEAAAKRAEAEAKKLDEHAEVEGKIEALRTKIVNQEWLKRYQGLLAQRQPPQDPELLADFQEMVKRDQEQMDKFSKDGPPQDERWNELSANLTADEIAKANPLMAALVAKRNKLQPAATKATASAVRQSAGLPSKGERKKLSPKAEALLSELEGY